MATIGDHVNSEIQTTIDEYEMNGIIASVFSGSVWHKTLFYRVLLELDLEEKISPVLKLLDKMKTLVALTGALISIGP